MCVSVEFALLRSKNLSCVPTTTINDEFNNLFDQAQKLLQYLWYGRTTGCVISSHVDEGETHLKCPSVHDRLYGGW